MSITAARAPHYLMVCERINGWRVRNGGAYVPPYPAQPHRHIAALLGYGSVVDMCEGFSEESANTLEALCGPHGYAIYRMLLINRQLLPEEE